MLCRDCMALNPTKEYQCKLSSIGRLRKDDTVKDPVSLHRKEELS